VTGFAGAGRRIDEAQVDYVDAGAREACRNLSDIALETIFETGELTPIGIESDAA
jgi:hypothetical protein